jgi:two-component system OmpR family response regulator
MDSLTDVVCIDDDQDILDIVELCLVMTAKLNVTCFQGGKKSITAIAAAKPDLILLDVMMPQMDGPTLLKQLQSHPVLKSTPVIFMTARCQAKEVEHYLSIGAIAVIEKPFDPMKLSQQLHTIYSKHCHSS